MHAVAREKNFLLGEAQRVVESVSVPGGGGDKNEPYDFPTARRRVSEKLLKATSSISALPPEACPNDEAVVAVTLHPRYLSKSDFPSDLFAEVGLRSVGSRSRTVVPENWGVEKHPVSATTEEIFAAAPRSKLREWAKSLERWTTKSRGAVDLGHIEDIQVVDANSKLRSIPSGSQILLEVVLHNAGGKGIERAFLNYASGLDAKPVVGKIREVRGLTFIPVWIQPERVGILAQFSFLRVARGMPSLRPFQPGLLRSSLGYSVKLPDKECLNSSTRALIFDGGLPVSALSILGRWVNQIDGAEIGEPHQAYQEHGLAVTSAFLFGPLEHGEELGAPVCNVDHVRVLDDSTGSADLDYYDVLLRITRYLDENQGIYSLVNISLGPSMAIDDDEITLWTAELDRRFANGRFVATVAAGNDGELDSDLGLNRIQPPADGVNILSVGACDSLGPGWSRASYSCVGPGRRPGIMKPDGLAFGGSVDNPFFVLDRNLRAAPVKGTSFAAPFALRSAAAIQTQMGDRLSPLAIRSLLIHQASNKQEVDWRQEGWGKFEDNPLRLITSEDNEAMVVFQGELPVGMHLRVPVPLVGVELEGKIKIYASLVIAPEVDPEYANNYTRSGLEVAFRPDSRKFNFDKNGRRSTHPKTKSFFSAKSLNAGGEQLLREEGHKWEPCLRSARSFKSDSLFEPAFDIYYHHRQGGAKAINPEPIQFAFVLRITAKKVKDLYNRVVRAYANVLVPVRPQVQIQLRR
jgi:hypothetical protein